jgi:hypothetical protein
MCYKATKSTKLEMKRGWVKKREDGIHLSSGRGKISSLGDWPESVKRGFQDPEPTSSLSLQLVPITVQTRSFPTSHLYSHMKGHFWLWEVTRQALYEQAEFSTHLEFENRLRPAHVQDLKLFTHKISPEGWEWHIDLENKWDYPLVFSMWQWTN